MTFYLWILFLLVYHWRDFINHIIIVFMYIIYDSLLFLYFTFVFSVWSICCVESAAQFKSDDWLIDWLSRHPDCRFSFIRLGSCISFSCLSWGGYLTQRPQLMSWCWVTSFDSKLKGCFFFSFFFFRKIKRLFMCNSRVNSGSWCHLVAVTQKHTGFQRNATSCTCSMALLV